MRWSTEVACWPNGLRERVMVRVRVRAGARECTTFFFFLQNVVNIFVFVGLVASGCI